tara:strand:- start:752 stop:1141 length:390 start_codon:yes stop_codon:yes gene_type:complete
MKVREFKKILKPIVEQTVKEVLLEQGVLSSVVTEVVKGMQSGGVTLVSENVEKEDTSNKEDDMQEKYEKERQARIKRLNESAGFDVFEGTRSLPPESSKSPLSGVSAADEGVDISGILSLASNKWKKLI